MLQISQLDIAPGNTVRFRNVTWKQYKQLLDTLGPHRPARIAYNNGRLELMVSTHRQEDSKEILGDLLKALMEELQIEFRSFGATTFERQIDLKAIEPAQCFYIKNEKAIRGKRRIDLSLDPPPDLALEFTDQPHLDIYQALRIPELWQISADEIIMRQLYAGNYIDVKESLFFPSLPLKDLLPYCLDQSRKLGRNTVIRDFRRWSRENAVP